jgi:hypothetical protein
MQTILITSETIVAAAKTIVLMTKTIFPTLKTIGNAIKIAVGKAKPWTPTKIPVVLADLGARASSPANAAITDLHDYPPGRISPFYSMPPASNLRFAENPIKSNMSAMAIRHGKRSSNWIIMRINGRKITHMME